MKTLVVSVAIAALLSANTISASSPPSDYSTRSSSRQLRGNSSKAGKEKQHAKFQQDRKSKDSYDGGYNDKIVHKEEEEEDEIESTVPSSPAEVDEESTTGAPTTIDEESTNDKCNMSNSQYETALRQLILTITPQDILDTITSPQSKAFHWLAYEDAISPPLCPPSLNDSSDEDGGHDSKTVMLLERYVMTAFYYATNGDGWTECSAPTANNHADNNTTISDTINNCTRTITAQSSEVLNFVIEQAFDDTASTTQPRRKIGRESWLTDSPTCDWGGLACAYISTSNENDGNDGYYTIDQIEFENNNLSGTLLPELSTLQSLKFLILEKGHLSGSIPPSFGSLSKLRVLDMDYNQLTGSIPNELYDLTKLRELDLNDNRLSGTIGSEIGNLSKLTYLQIDNNEFEGSFPMEVGGLTELGWAIFHSNHFTGEVPASVCENSDRASPPGKIALLTADCFEGGPVACSCCDYCGEAV